MQSNSRREQQRSLRPPNDMQNPFMHVLYKTLRLEKEQDQRNQASHTLSEQEKQRFQLEETICELYQESMLFYKKAAFLQSNAPEDKNLHPKINFFRIRAFQENLLKIFLDLPTCNQEKIEKFNKFVQENKTAFLTLNETFLPTWKAYWENFNISAEHRKQNLLLIILSEYQLLHRLWGLGNDINEVKQTWESKPLKTLIEIYFQYSSRVEMSIVLWSYEPSIYSINPQYATAHIINNNGFTQWFTTLQQPSQNESKQENQHEEQEQLSELFSSEFGLELEGQEQALTSSPTSSVAESPLQQEQSPLKLDQTYYQMPSQEIFLNSQGSNEYQSTKEALKEIYFHYAFLYHKTLFLGMASSDFREEKPDVRQNIFDVCNIEQFQGLISLEKDTKTEQNQLSQQALINHIGTNKAKLEETKQTFDSYWEKYWLDYSLEKCEGTDKEKLFFYIKNRYLFLCNIEKISPNISALNAWAQDKSFKALVEYGCFLSAQIMIRTDYAASEGQEDYKRISNNFMILWQECQQKTQQQQQIIFLIKTCRFLYKQAEGLFKIESYKDYPNKGQQKKFEEFKKSIVVLYNNSSEILKRLQNSIQDNHPFVNSDNYIKKNKVFLEGIKEKIDNDWNAFWNEHFSSQSNLYSQLNQTTLIPLIHENFQLCNQQDIDLEKRYPRLEQESVQTLCEIYLDISSSRDIWKDESAEIKILNGNEDENDEAFYECFKPTEDKQVFQPPELQSQQSELVQQENQHQQLVFSSQNFQSDNLEIAVKNDQNIGQALPKPLYLKSDEQSKHLAYPPSNLKMSQKEIVSPRHHKKMDLGLPRRKNVVRNDGLKNSCVNRINTTHAKFSDALSERIDDCVIQGAKWSPGIVEISFSVFSVCITALTESGLHSAAGGLSQTFCYLNAINALWVGMEQLSDEREHRRTIRKIKGLTNIASGTQLLTLTSMNASLYGGPALAVAFGMSFLHSLEEVYRCGMRLISPAYRLKDAQSELEKLNEEIKRLDIILGNNSNTSSFFGSNFRKRKMELSLQKEKLKDYIQNFSDTQIPAEALTKYRKDFVKAILDSATKGVVFSGMIMACIMPITTVPVIAVALVILLKNRFSEQLADKVVNGIWGNEQKSLLVCQPALT